MLVEEQMELIERRAGKLPVMLLVEIAQRHRVHKQLIEVLDTLQACGLVERDRQFDKVAERLDLMRVLVVERLCAPEDLVGIKYGFGHDGTPERCAS